MIINNKLVSIVALNLHKIALNAINIVNYYLIIKKDQHFFITRIIYFKK